MNVKPDSCTSARRSPKLSRAEIETIQRRRVEHFRVLKAVTELLEPTGAPDGCVTGTLSEFELSVRTGVSRKAAARSMRHWREWRVLWLWCKGGRVWDVRFERAVVDPLLAAWGSSPRTVGRMLIEHRRKREAIAPRRVPKTLSQEPSQLHGNAGSVTTSS